MIKWPLSQRRSLYFKLLFLFWPWTSSEKKERKNCTPTQFFPGLTHNLELVLDFDWLFVLDVDFAQIVVLVGHSHVMEEQVDPVLGATQVQTGIFEDF